MIFVTHQLPVNVPGEPKLAVEFLKELEIGSS